MSLREVYGREHDHIGIPPGLARVVVWGDADTDPTELAIQVTAVP